MESTGVMIKRKRRKRGKASFEERMQRIESGFEGIGVWGVRIPRSSDNSRISRSQRLRLRMKIPNGESVEFKNKSRFLSGEVKNPMK